MRTSPGLARALGRSTPRFAWASALFVALLAWGLHLLIASTVVQFSPDMVEFVDVARRVAAGESYILGIKAYHIGGSDVLRDGLIHRPALFTLVTAGLLRLGFGLPAVQVANTGFGALSAAMVCSLGSARSRLNSRSRSSAMPWRPPSR